MPSPSASFDSLGSSGNWSSMSGIPSPSLSNGLYVVVHVAIAFSISMESTNPSWFMSRTSISMSFLNGNCSKNSAAVLSGSCTMKRSSSFSQLQTNANTSVNSINPSPEMSMSLNSTSPGAPERRNSSAFIMPSPLMSDSSKKSSNPSSHSMISLGSGSGSGSGLGRSLVFQYATMETSEKSSSAITEISNLPAAGEKMYNSWLVPSPYDVNSSPKMSSSRNSNSSKSSNPKKSS